MANVNRSWFSVSVLLWLGGCGALDARADLALNSRLYQDVPFVTRAPGDRPVFVAPICDERDQQVLPAHDHGLPISYGSDTFWERPVPTMLDEVLRRQLEDSGLVASVVDTPTPDCLLLKPRLCAFTTGAIEQISGARTFAEVTLHVEVYGPAAADGTRPLWHDRVYGNRQTSDIEVKPVSPYWLIGGALRTTVQKWLAGIDGSNVARSSVPIEAIEPGERSGERPAERPAEASAQRR